MGIQRVKVVNPNESWLGTECYIDENKVNNVKSIDFRVAYDEVPRFMIETNGLPDIDISGDIHFSFMPETLFEASVVLISEFRANQERMSAFVDSIESTIKDAPDEIDSRDLAVMIAKRIVGLEKE